MLHQKRRTISVITGEELLVFDTVFLSFRVQITAMIRNVFDTEVEANSLAEPRCRVVKQFIALYKKVCLFSFFSLLLDFCYHNFWKQFYQF